ncbi:MAG: transglycosylase domain-containing protein [Lachnospiraceae bacterium]|nr:transglycosylase domain-containing protein [Lachnospiraceae bacterium]
MNFSEQELLKKQNMLSGSRIKWKNRIRVTARLTVIILLITVILLSVFCGAGVMKGLFDSAPAVEDLDLMPTGYATTIYDAGGHQIQTLMGSDANREYVTIDQIPGCVQYAFVAIEDARFYEHHGVDMKGIARAVYEDIASKQLVQGGSTITQQLLKNQVFAGGNEKTFYGKFTRKVQEQYLAVQLENNMDKEQILEYYLNTINLGQNTLGVQTASKRYFNKDISQVSISEAAVLAGITQNPTEYNPITKPENNSERRKIVLKYMLDQKYITEEDYEDALGDDVYARIQSTNQKKSSIRTSVNSYYVDAVIDSVLDDLKQKLGYTETQAYNALYRCGLKIYTCQEAELQEICDDVINDDSNYPTGTPSYLTYHLAVEGPDGTVTEYTELDLRNFFEQSGQQRSLYFSGEKEAKKYIRKFRKAMKLGGGKTKEEHINLIKQPQTSFVLLEQSTGEVKAIVGGRGDKTANRTLNRATASVRQPGSTFKILSTYLPALDSCGMTLASVEDDAPYQYPGTNTPVRNWSGEVYKGLTTLREGIIQSMNVVTVKAFNDVTPQTGFDYLQKLRFTTVVEERKDDAGNVYTDIQLPTALGGLTDGVTNLELTAAYAAIANGGEYRKPIFYTKIVDAKGNVLISNDDTSTRVMKETTAWLLTDAMTDVVTKGTGKAVALDNDKIALAGKTGTTSNNSDYWFEGYTPYYTAGIWTGYDSELSQQNDSYHKKMWKQIMDRIHSKKKSEDKRFGKPKGIISVNICSKCGNLAVIGLCNEAKGGSAVHQEYFAKGTEPDKKCDCHVKYRICRSSGHLATQNCPESNCYYMVYLKKNESGATADTPNVIPQSMYVTCGVHG